MAIKIIKETTDDEAIDDSTIIETVERNRDRIRTIANMALTMASIMVSTTVAFALYVTEHRAALSGVAAVFSVATISFFVAVLMNIVASSLRQTYVLSSRSQFVLDLLSLYTSELRLLRISFVPLFAGFALTLVGLLMFVF